MSKAQERSLSDFESWMMKSGRANKDFEFTIGDDQEYIYSHVAEDFYVWCAAVASMSPASSEQQAAQQDELNQAARDVLAERQRQISVEGWTTEHDDLYRSTELACAAACYALGTKDLTKGQGEVWPFEDLWWNPSDRRRNLIKASALLLAELERIDRAAARASNGGKAND